MTRSSSSFLTAACRLTSAALVAIGAGLTTADATDTLRIGGTGSALGGIQHVADAFKAQHPDIDVVVLPSLGSGGGIKALSVGKIEIAVSARPLNEAEKAAGLVEREYARTPLVFVTRHDTAADGVTLAELTGAYRGDIAAWPDGSRLRLVMRPASEADTAFLRTLSPEMDKAIDTAIARDDLFVAINDQDNAKALEDIHGSLGLISLGQIRSENRALKPLTLDGSTGTLETLSDGSYPHAKHLYVMVGARPSPAAEAFLAFLFSADGGRLLTDVGYLPTLPVD